jgi:transposase InsO family protein
MSHETDRTRYIIPRLPGYNSWMKKIVSCSAYADSDTAQYRLKVVEYYQQFGMKATLSAFPVKRSTVFLWRKTLRENKGRLSSLIPKSSRPHGVRKMQTHPLVLAEICRLRRKHYRLGKKKLFPLLKRYCLKVGISYPAISTIGKIIKRNGLFFDKPTYGYHDPARKKHNRRKKLRARYAPKPQAGGYVQLDTIETVLGGLRRYTITAIDVKLKVAYAQTFKSKTASNALIVLKTLQVMLPVAIHTVQTDNGSEFENVFDSFCRKKNITHKWTYPNHPKVNGVIERFNRFLQEEWLDMYQDELIEPKLVNKRIAEYLYFYHNDRIHESLNDQAPATTLGKEIKSPKGVWPVHLIDTLSKISYHQEYGGNI